MTIQDLSRLTGLSIDVLRVWERRYGALRPKRLSNRRRDYDDADVRRAQLLREARRAGHTISLIARMNDDELAALLAETSPSNDAAAVASLLESVHERNADALYGGLKTALADRTPAAFCDRIVSPLLREVGEYWLTDPALIAQEHLVSSCVMRVLTGHPPPTRSNGRSPLVFATIPNERHVIGSAMAAFVADQLGFPAITLGTGASMDEIVDLVKRVRARGLGMSVVYQNAEHTLRTMAQALAGVPMWVGGAKAMDGPWQRVRTMEQFAAFLNAA